ncbi:hypothetical protein [Metallosphaera javensis (ex Sakai et al. 2022)]|nr:MAG: hypothetical protein MjAS7_2031 [Metallosphaera javensis (ex Sakai et al. 2022)]
MRGSGRREVARCDGKGRVKTKVERELPREEEDVLRNSRSTRCRDGR